MNNTIYSYVLPVVIAYLLGSFLPGYFLPLWLRKVDIRKIGDGNPGTINVKRTLGYPLAILVGFYDIGKGLLSMLIAYKLFRAPVPIVTLSGFASIMGHKYPFYLRFKGGRGIAATLGIFVFMIARISIEFFSTYEIVLTIIFIIVYAILTRLATHDENFFTVTFLPILGAILSIKVKELSELLLVLFLMGMIFYESSKNLKLKMFKLSSEKYTLWRVFIRPMALLFILVSELAGRKVVMYLSGSVLLASFIFDLVRFAIPRFERMLEREIFPDVKILRARERGRISSITNFMLGIFFVFVFFPQSIAYASIGFMSLGDMFAKIVGINYGETKIFGRSGKSIEGTMGFLSAALAVAFLAWMSGFLALWYGTVGALAAAAVESFPSQIDDNVSVPVVSGAIMLAVQRLFL